MWINTARWSTTDEALVLTSYLIAMFMQPGKMEITMITGLLTCVSDGCVFTFVAMSFYFGANSLNTVRK